MGTFKVMTLGCKVNQYESAFFEESLIRSGWRRSTPESGADIVVVNTCIVTQKAAHQSRQEIRKAVRENPDARVAAVGCYAQRFPEELEAIDGIALIANNRIKAEVPRILMELQKSDARRVLLPPFAPESPYDEMSIHRFPGRTRAYLKIQDGCRSFCTYCIVPYTRGPYRSLKPKSALAALERFADQDYREVVLTGIHLGKYGVDLGGNMNLKKLLQMVGKEKMPLRLRLSSLELPEVEPEIVHMAASESWLCPHFHIPLQSGDDRTLKRMNRNDNTGDFARKIEMMHSVIPEGAIGLDVMAGFPGEDDSAHKNTISLIRDLPVSYLHVFPFSARKGTPAWHYKSKVPISTIKERAAELRKLGLIKRKIFYQRSMGNAFEVLVEGHYAPDHSFMTGAAENYLPFVFSRDDSLKGQVIGMRAKEVFADKILGERITAT